MNNALNTPSVVPDFKATRRLHRRRVWLQIRLPVIAAGVVVFGGALFLALTLSGMQLGMVAALMASLFLLLPMVLLCMLPYVMLIFAVVGMGSLNRRAPRLLKRARNITFSLNQGSQRLSHLVAAPIISVSNRLAWLERALGLEPPRAK